VDDAPRRRRTDRLFGKIAVELGILTPEKLAEALEVQASRSPAPPLGLVLMDLRLVGREDLAKILDAQRALVDRQRERGKEQHDDQLFGKVAVGLGFVTQDQLTECLGVQKRDGADPDVRLGELMTRRGLISPDQVRRVMEVQAGLAVPCPRCATLHNVIMFMPGSTFPCRKCSLMIAVPPRP
jgi:hypothetical protein